MPSPLPWLEPGNPFPHASRAWGDDDAAPGLLAGGGALNVETLISAYRGGIFPWFSDGQPILWWSPHPRMVLFTEEFRLHRSLKKALGQFVASSRCEIRIDSSFNEVITACSVSPRSGQSGTWIVPEMVNAYQRLHEQGGAHSVETWIDGQLVGGLYCVAIGRAVFGESMFSRVTDASKLALCALVAFCRENDVGWIDCQQNTRHLASMGAREISRNSFLAQVEADTSKPSPRWAFSPLYWRHLIP